MKFYILGAGAMGCLYGAGIRQAGYDVTLIDVDPFHMRAINKKGLSVQFGEAEDIVRIEAHRAANCTEPADYMIVFTKSIYSEEALESVKHLITPDTTLVSFQNGLGHEEVLGRYADPDHVIVGTTSFACDLLGYGRIRAGGFGVTNMMTASGNVTPAAQTLADVFTQAGLNPTVTDQVFRAIWEKVAFNAAANTLTAITVLPFGRVGEVPEGKDLAHQIVREVIGVANAKGVPADCDRVLNMVDTLMVEHFDHYPSMLQDVLKERETEVGFINGAVVREAEKLGMRVPVTETLYKLMCVYQKTYEYRVKE
ncbi:MAG: ketopantoate reductase family protein [Lachnospiraceae bacterium]|nr:ketopantoate reductase family protein [Lachnospiraceae bacterium]